MTATMTLNTALNGIEITFPEKPSQNTLTALKSNGFRWHGKKKVWYAKQTPERMTLAQEITDGKKIAVSENQNIINYKKKAKQKAEKKNVYGVEVGDIFSASWGYEQTNNNFFQVVALVGEKSVRVREVHPTIISREPTCGMAEDRVYKLTKEILPPAKHSVFIKDQENGDVKRIKPGYYKDPEEARKHCYFDLSSYASAYKCNSETEKVYESWYY